MSSPRAFRCSCFSVSFVLGIHPCLVLGSLVLLSLCHRWIFLQFPCLAGRWSADISRTSECTSSCDAGHYCPTNSSNSRPFECGAPSLYCPLGSPSPLNVDPGMFSTGGNSRTRTNQSSCTSALGVFCPGDGFQHDCPAGRFGSDGGLSDPSCTDSCQAGYFCPPRSFLANQSTARLHVLLRFCFPAWLTHLHNGLPTPLEWATLSASL